MIIFIVTLISCSYGIIAIAFTGKRPAKKYYQQILKPRNIYWHLAGTSLVGVIGYYLARYVEQWYCILFVPLIFLLLLLLCNWITQLIYGRNVILLYKGDAKPKEFVWYVDGIFSLICLIGPMMLVAFCGQYFLQFHEVKIGITR